MGEPPRVAKLPVTKDSGQPDLSLQPAGAIESTSLGFQGLQSQNGSLYQRLSSNPFFTAGFGLAGLGAGLALLQRGSRQAAALLRRRLLVDVEISKNDKSYQWFLHWMSQYQRAQLVGVQSAGHDPAPTLSLLGRLIKRMTPGLHHLSIQTTQSIQPSGGVHTRFSLIPGPGRHLLRYKNAFIAIHRERELKNMDFTTGTPWETVRLTTLYSQRHVFEDLFAEAHKLAVKAQEGKTIIYTSRGIQWEAFGEPRRKRPLSSVVLDEGVGEAILEDVKDFIGSSQWYTDRGIPYRRGYLLHGPPGSGKTSFIQALAGELGSNIAIINLSERGLTDDRLIHLLAHIPSSTIVLLEDVDAAFVNRTQVQSDGYSGANVTYSGLLNALDGVASAEERILFLTTNHPEKLDMALIRPGRVDMSVRIGEPSEHQVRELFRRFYTAQDSEGRLEKQFVEKLRRMGVMVDASAGVAGARRTSVAALQGLFLYNKDDPKGALNMAERLVEEVC